LGDRIRQTIEELKDLEVAAYEKTRKKKDPDLDRTKINVRLPDEILQRIVKEYLASPACMNKGFILDGYPRNLKDAYAIFTEKNEDEPKAADLPAEEKRTVNQKIVPQFCIIFDSENDFLKQRVQKLPKEEVDGTHFTDAHMDRRLKVFRESNANAASEKHILKFFHDHIGTGNCMVLTGPESDNPKETLVKMQQTCERNGKPCCLNLITEPDSKFMAKIAKEKRLKEEALAAEQAREAALAAELAAAKDPKGKKGEDPKVAAALAEQ
jgi:adenylate kinase family enzyme